jgi:CHAD domain-containing protein
MAKARDIQGLDAEDSYGQSAARIVSVRAREVVDNAAGVLDMGDIERVHDMRVATRRLRAALEIFEPCFPAKRCRRALDEVKELADALGERRDRDVAIEVLEGFAAEIATPDRPGVEGLIAELREEQREANEELAEYVTPEHLAALHERLTELIAMARGIERGVAVEVDEIEPDDFPSVDEAPETVEPPEPAEPDGEPETTEPEPDYEQPSEFAWGEGGPG